MLQKLIEIEKIVKNLYLIKQAIVLDALTFLWNKLLKYIPFKKGR